MNMNFLPYEVLKHAYKRRGEPEALRTIAEYCWRAILALVFVGLIGAFAHGTWVLNDVSAKLNEPPSQFIPSPVVLNRVQLSAELTALQKRKADFNQLKSAGAGLVDPSRVR